MTLNVLIKERFLQDNEVLLRKDLQDLQAAKQVRIGILSGEVDLSLSKGNWNLHGHCVRYYRPIGDTASLDHSRWYQDGRWRRCGRLVDDGVCAGGCRG